jgi:hypothetical protein
MKCLLLPKAVWHSIKIFSELPIHSENMTKYLFLSTTLELWRTLVVSPSTKTIFSEAKHPPLPNVYSSRLQICMSWRTCGSETSLPWNGGTTFGLMNHSPLLCHSLPCSTRQKFHTFTLLVGYPSNVMHFGVCRQTSCQVLTQYVQISYRLTKLKVFSME